MLAGLAAAAAVVSWAVAWARADTPAASGRALDGAAARPPEALEADETTGPPVAQEAAPAVTRREAAAEDPPASRLVPLTATVVDERGAPVPDVPVLAQDAAAGLLARVLLEDPATLRDDTPRGVQLRFSDAAGRVVFDAEPGLRYALRVHPRARPGFRATREPRRHVFENSYRPGGHTALAVSVAAEDGRLDPPDPELRVWRTRDVEVRVLTPSGHPAVRVPLGLLPLDGGTWIGSWTDGSGTLRVADVPSGRFALLVMRLEDPEPPPATQYDAWPSPPPVLVEFDAADRDPRLPPLRFGIGDGIVEGRVVGDDGGPPPATVDLVRAIPDSEGSRYGRWATVLRTTTGPDGRYTFGNVEPGRYGIRVGDDTREPAQLEDVVVRAGSGPVRAPDLTGPVKGRKKD